MKTIKLSTINHVTAAKSREWIPGAAYYDVITSGGASGREKILIYPDISGFYSTAVAVMYRQKWYILTGDHFYKGYFVDGGPRLDYGSPARPASELFEMLGFMIDLES